MAYRVKLYIDDPTVGGEEHTAVWLDVTANLERHRVVVRVVDNGAGIPAGVRGHMFDPFFSTKPVGKGTGLGLDIVRRLVAHNNAEIEVESQPGRTEFRVSLPLAGTDAAGGRT